MFVRIVRILAFENEFSVLTLLCVDDQLDIKKYEEKMHKSVFILSKLCGVQCSMLYTYSIQTSEVGYYQKCPLFLNRLII